MGHPVTAMKFCLVLSTLAGCSLIYNPSNLPNPASDGPDAPPPDSEDKFDADPGLLALEGVFPSEIFEGTGTGGSRKGVLTVHGTNIVSGAKITVSLHAGQTGDPKITIDDALTDVAANGNIVAAPYTLDINDQLADGATIRLDVTVTQPNGGASVVATLTEKTPDADDALLVVKGLDELTGAATASGTKEYSEVNADSIATTPGEVEPVIIHARGRIAVTGAITANANGQDAGAGGNPGGDGGLGALIGPGPGTAGAGPGGPTAGGKPSGGGGGFATAGDGGALGGPPAGEPEIRSFVTSRSSGGAGGKGTGVNGGAGGGGGGTIELTAGGTLSVTTVTANGGIGAPGVDGGLGADGDAGGGGSGGLILLRGAEVTATSLTVGFGTGKNNGALGRTRVDAASPSAPAAGYRGIMLDKTTALITKNPTPMITVYGTNNMSFKYRIKSLNSAQVSNNLDGSIGDQGENSFVLDAPLFRGLNQVCVFMPGADLVNQRDEARNCVEIAYLISGM